MDADKGFIMIKAMHDLIRFLLGYCFECGSYFKYPRESVRSGYMVTDPIYYQVCRECAAKMLKMTDAEWLEYHANA